MQEYLLELEGISKHFPGVQALDHVNLKLKHGTVHALVGENGAGKSTLMKCLLGIYQMSGGEVLIEGKPIKITNVKGMHEMGISIIQQELSPILERSVMENIWLEREPLRFGVFVDHKKMYQDTLKLLKQFNLCVNPRTKMSNLTVAEMQIVEIIKAVSWGARIVMMDEPTSALTDKEVVHLFEIICELKKRGVGIIYVSHKMDEIYQIADEVTVLRDGKWISSHNMDEVTIEQIIHEMVGRKIEETKLDTSRKFGEVILNVQNISAKRAFHDVSFELHRGEILGIAGLVGSGRTEILEALFGLRSITNGKLLINGKIRVISNPRQAIQNGMALLTEERRKDGIISVLNIAENILVTNYDKFVNRLGLICPQEAIKSVKEYISLLSIKTQGWDEIIANLSGGNQQKVLLARWLLSKPEILLLDEPTRGIDVGAKSEIYAIINKLAIEGKSIIVVSSEMPEILKISDRIVVMSEGNMKGIISRDEANQEKIMSMVSNHLDSKEGELPCS